MADDATRPHGGTRGMSWQRWIRAPQTLSFRRVAFQLHLWTGILLGAWIVMISVTGSAIVMKPQITQSLIRESVPMAEGEPLSGDALAERIATVYADDTVVSIVEPRNPQRSVRVVLERGGEPHQRYFDPYTGEDLGSTFPPTARVLQWTADLHADLLLGQTGRKVNGIAGGVFTAMVLTGLLLWWPGRRGWKQSLLLWPGGARDLSWKLHSFAGFWSLALMLAWGITAIYFAFPDPFNELIDWLDRDSEGFRRPDAFLLLLIDLHFGRFAGTGTLIVWTVLGLLPAAMFVTGFTLWIRRLTRRLPRRNPV